MRVYYGLALAATLFAPAQQWEHTFDSSIRAVSAVPLGKCLAVMTDTELSVLDDAGGVIWRRDIRPILRWMSHGGAVAVSPQCDWAVLSGSHEYRYAWVIERTGARRYVSFTGESPAGVAVSPDGTQFAVSTGADRLYIFSRGGERLHLTRGARLARELAYTPDGDILPFQGYGARRLTADGRMLWQDRALYCTTYLQPDASSISYCVPPHGPGGTLITARARDGRELWEKVVLDGQPEEPVRDFRRYVVEARDATIRVRIR